MVTDPGDNGGPQLERALKIAWRLGGGFGRGRLGLRRLGGRSRAARFQPLDPRKQRRRGGVDLGRSALDQHQLELNLGLRAVGRRLQRGRDQVEQAYHVASRDDSGLLGHATVALGSHAQLERQLAEHLHGE